MNKIGQISKTLTLVVALIPILILSALFLSGSYYLDKNKPLSAGESIQYPRFLDNEIIIENKNLNVLGAFVSYKNGIISKENFLSAFISSLDNENAECVMLIGRNKEDNPGREDDFFLEYTENGYKPVTNPGLIANMIKPYLSNSKSVYLLKESKLEYDIYAYAGECLHE